jgi:O-succinylbenzoate synthase
VIRANVYLARLRLAKPVAAAQVVHEQRSSVFLSLDDGTTCGWAECPAALTTGVDPTESELLAALATALGAPGAPGRGRFATVADGVLATARLDARLRHTRTSFAQDLGVSARSVGFAGVVGIGAAHEMANRARELVELGATRLRVKVAPGLGAPNVRAVLAAVDVPVVADANGSFEGPGDPDLQELAELPLAWLEQPLAPGREADAAWLVDRGVRLGADESLTSIDALERSAASGVTVVCVKPSRFGVRGAIEVLERVVTLRIDAYVGGYFEAGLARAVLGVLAARYTQLDGDVVAPRTYLEDDPCGLDGPVQGRQPLYLGAGLGPLPRTEALVAFYEVEVPPEVGGSVS